MLPKLEDLKDTRYPKNLVLESISLCNLRCRLCPYRKLRREKGVMSNKMFSKIIKEVGADSPDTVLWLAFMGEPLLQGLEMARKVHQAKLAGIKKVCLNTNGIFLEESIAVALVKAQVDQVFVSIDAMTPATYRTVRDETDFIDLKHNVFRLLDIARKHQDNKTEVVVQFVVCDENRSEEKAFKKFWLEAGATVKIRKKLGWGTVVDTPDLLETERTIPCPWLMRQMIVLWDGTVAQCDADYEGGYWAGHLSVSSIYDVWNGELYKRRQRHLEGDFEFEPCSTCDDWQVGISEVFRP